MQQSAAYQSHRPESAALYCTSLCKAVSPRTATLAGMRPVCGATSSNSQHASHGQLLQSSGSQTPAPMTSGHVSRACQRSPLCSDDGVSYQKHPCASSRRASATRGPNHRCHHAVLEALSCWHFDAVIASSSASTPSARCRPPAPRRVRHVAAARAPAAVRPLPSRSSPRPLPCIISHSSTSDDLARHASVSHVDLSPTPLLPATSCVRISPSDLHWPCVVATSPPTPRRPPPIGHRLRPPSHLAPPDDELRRSQP
jgi:hypothetical protein